jgi:hypothetical protein
VADLTKPDGNELTWPVYDGEIRENFRATVQGDDSWIQKLAVTNTFPRVELFKTGTTARAALVGLGGDVAIGSNAYVDPAGNWQRWDSAAPSWSFYTSVVNDEFAIRRTAAGAGAITWSTFFKITSLGYVAIGGRTPSGPLDAKLGATSGFYWIQNGGGLAAFQATDGASPAGAVKDVVLQYNGGNVGIAGAPGTKLDVGGTIRSTGITVAASGAGLESEYGSGTAWLRGYDRSLSQYTPIRLNDTLQVDASGNLIPVSDNARDLGSPTARFKRLNVGRIQAGAATPTATVTGAGSTGAIAVDTGSSDLAVILTITPGGTSIATSGTVVLTFSTGNGAYGSNTPSIIPVLGDGSGTWAAGAWARPSNTLSTTSVTINWNNNGVALTSGSTYKLHVHVIAK